MRTSTISKILLTIVALMLLALLGCNTEKRCSRVKGRHPECFETVMIPIETVRTDTIYRNYEPTDTVIRLNLKDSSKIDTFFIYTPKVVTRIIHHKDTISVTNTVAPDTVFKTYTKTIQGIAVKVPFIPMWVWAVILGLVAFIILIIKRR